MCVRQDWIIAPNHSFQGKMLFEDKRVILTVTVGPSTRSPPKDKTWCCWGDQGKQSAQSDRTTRSACAAPWPTHPQWEGGKKEKLYRNE